MRLHAADPDHERPGRDRHATVRQAPGDELPPATPAVPRPVSLAQIVRAFAFIGATSFGGGMTGYIRKALVEDRGWLESEEFLRGLSVAQLVPGPNAVNLAVFIGYRMHGALGAMLAVCAVFSIPVLVLAVLATAWATWGVVPSVAGVIHTLGAFGVGLMAATGLAMARAARLGALDVVLAALAFTGVAVLRWSVPVVLLSLAFVSVCLRWVVPETAANGDA